MALHREKERKAISYTSFSFALVLYIPFQIKAIHKFRLFMFRTDKRYGKSNTLQLCRFRYSKQLQIDPRNQKQTNYVTLDAIHTPKLGHHACKLMSVGENRDYRCYIDFLKKGFRLQTRFKRRRRDAKFTTTLTIE